MRSQSKSLPPSWEAERKKPFYRFAVIISSLLLWALLFAAFGLAVLAFRWMIGTF
jgi:hypothetical protein